MRWAHTRPPLPAARDEVPDLGYLLLATRAIRGTREPQQINQPLDRPASERFGVSLHPSYYPVKGDRSSGRHLN